MCQLSSCTSGCAFLLRIRPIETLFTYVLSTNHDVSVVQLYIRVRFFIEDAVGAARGSQTNQLPVVYYQLVSTRRLQQNSCDRERLLCGVTRDKIEILLQLFYVI